MNGAIFRAVTALAVLALALAGCGPAAAPTPAPETQQATAALRAYATLLPSATATPRPPGTPTPLPSPTPTPRTHTVARGEDLGGIAFRYHISVAELMAANPQVNPNVMSIGTVLVIPGSGPAPTEAAPLPTPDGRVQLSTVHCARGREGGAWCFVLASNPSKNDFESISAVIRTAGTDGSNPAEQTAAALLNLLPAGEQAALAAYFPAPVSWPLAASAELASSFPRDRGDGRYLEAKIENEQIEIATDGLSARVRGEVALAVKDTAGQVSVAAAAMRDGDVIGVRRWDSRANPAGQRIAFDFTVYSTGGAIEKVILLAEARP